MADRIRIAAVLLLGAIAASALFACAAQEQRAAEPAPSPAESSVEATAGDAMPTEPERSAEEVLGEQVYLNGRGEDGVIPRAVLVADGGGEGEDAVRRGGNPPTGGCVDCHGLDGRGGSGEEGTNAPDVRYSALAAAGWSDAQIEAAILESVGRDGRPLGEEMPAWDMSPAELSALLGYLKALP